MDAFEVVLPEKLGTEVAFVGPQGDSSDERRKQSDFGRSARS
jgi:hypothetical protein